VSDPSIYTLLESMQATLQGVTVPEGYRTNIGSRVSLELPQTDGELESDFGRVVLAMEGDIAIQNFSTRHRKRDFQIVAEVLLSADEDNAQARAHDALQDLLDVIPGTVRYVQASGIESDVTPIGASFTSRPLGMPCIEIRVVYSVVMTERLSA